MPVAILEFELPGDKHDLYMALKSRDFYGMLWDICQVLRNVQKHGDPSEETLLLINQIRNQIDYQALDDVE